MSLSPLCANTGHRQPHSMTSSVRASSVGGISMPSALAVLLLITSSSFTPRKFASTPRRAQARGPPIHPVRRIGADKPCGRAGIGAAIFTKNLLISAFVGPWKRRQFLLYSRCCSGVGKLGKQKSIKRLFSRRPRLPCEFLIPAGGEGHEL
jgi:hypothetical protein